MLERSFGLHGTLPRGQGWRVGFTAMAQQVVEADGEVAQRDHVARGLGPRDTAGVLAEGHVAHPVGAVLDGVPVADDDSEPATWRLENPQSSILNPQSSISSSSLGVLGALAVKNP